jgi:hypothetical protein
MYGSCTNCSDYIALILLNLDVGADMTVSPGRNSNIEHHIRIRIRINNNKNINNTMAVCKVRGLITPSRNFVEVR